MGWFNFEEFGRESFNSLPKHSSEPRYTWCKKYLDSIFNQSGKAVEFATQGCLLLRHNQDCFLWFWRFKVRDVVEIFIDMSELPEQFVIQSSEAVRINFSSTLREKSTTAETEIVAKTTTLPTVATPVDTVHKIAQEIAQEMTIEPTIIVDESPVLETTVTAPTQHDDSDHHDKKPVVVVDKKECEKTSEKKPLNVPKAVGESNQKACHNHFDTLSHKEQQDVLLVFYSMLKTGTIRNKANYFIGICKLAKTDDLTLPTEVISQKKPSAKQIAKQQEEEKRRDLWSDYVCIQQFAQAEQVSEKVIAERLEMMEAYEMFGRATEVAKQRLIA